MHQVVQRPTPPEQRLLRLNYTSKTAKARFHLQTLEIYKFGFTQNHHTFSLILLTKIVLCSQLS